MNSDEREINFASVAITTYDNGGVTLTLGDHGIFVLKGLEETKLLNLIDGNQILVS